MKITPVLMKIANSHAEQRVKSDLETIRRELGAFDDAYDETGVPEDILESDKASLLAAYKKSYDPALMQKSFDLMRENFLNYAKTRPEPRRVAEPILHDRKTEAIVLCRPWYHWIPLIDWDPIDYDKTKARAYEAKTIRIKQWEEDMHKYAQEVIEAYKEALGLS